MKVNPIPVREKSILFLSLCCLLLQSVTSNGQTEPLFVISENNKYGLLDANGNVAVKPIFLAMGEFSEDLAPARINGTYGYINAKGIFVIPAQFDYATPFHEGLALVYQQGKPAFINARGENPFSLPYPYADFFHCGRAQVKTASGKFGFINLKGELFIDTVYSRVNEFINGTCVVEGIHHQPNPEKGEAKKIEIGVIDSLGRFIIPYGKFEQINSLQHEYFMAEIPAEPWDSLEGYTTQTAVVNRSGNIIFSRDHKNNSWLDGPFFDGLAKINLYKHWLPEEEGTSYTTAKSYEGFINLKGEVVIDDTTYKYANRFSNGRAFVRPENGDYFMIDTNGKRISEEVYSDVAGEGFYNGLAVVRKDDKYGIIDTNGNFVVAPAFDGIEEGIIRDNVFFFYTERKENQYNRAYGAALTDGTILIEPVMDYYDMRGFQNKLLACVIKNKLTYLNKQGKIVWQQTNTPHSPVNVNIDYMNRGYFYAQSRPDKHDLGGFGKSDNAPKRFSKSEGLPKNSLSVMLNPAVRDTLPDGYNGMKVTVANSLKRKIQFNAQDSRLNMIVQAKNPQGEWQDIEYLPSSWCGNSYHTLALDAQHTWTFITPVYEGDYKTQLRIKLNYVDPADHSKRRYGREELTVYSNEYEGSINPAQFWRKEGYTPSGIMDPYMN